VLTHVAHQDETGRGRQSTLGDQMADPVDPHLTVGAKESSVINPMYPRPDHFVVKLLVVMTAALTCSIITIATGLFGPLEMPRYRATPAPTSAPLPTPTRPPIAPPQAGNPAGSPSALTPQRSSDWAVSDDTILVMLVLAAFVPMSAAVASFHRAQQRHVERMLAEQRRLIAQARQLESDRFVSDRRTGRERFWRDQYWQARREQDARLRGAASRDGHGASQPTAPVPTTATRHGARRIASWPGFTRSPWTEPLNGKRRGDPGGVNGSIDPFEESVK
jgi:hypothetical protein